MIVATLTTALSVVVDLAAGFALAKLQFAGRTAVVLVVLSTLMVPAQAVMIPQFELVARMGLIGLFWAVILPSASTALGVFLARQFFVSVPDELLDAARLDGCGTVATLATALPPCLLLLVLFAALQRFSVDGFSRSGIR